METQILNYWAQFQDDTYSKTVVRELNYTRNETVKQILKKCIPDVKTIAEIGTGSGSLANDLRNMGYITCGLDLPKVIAGCKERYPETEFLEFNAEINTLSPVDVIIASEIVEHLADDFGFLQRCKESTNNLILTIPVSNYIAQGDHHLRAYSKYSMQKLLAVAGFKTIYYHDDGSSQYFYARALEVKQ